MDAGAIAPWALIAAALSLAVSAGGAPSTNAGGTPVAFVAVRETSQLVAVDLTTKQIVRRLAVPKGPTTMAATGDARYLLVTSPPARSVTLIDSFTSKVVTRFAGFGRPLDVAVQGPHAFVTDARWNFLFVIDLELRSVGPMSSCLAGRRTSRSASSRSSRIARGILM